jgi:tetratricopeptide (TPR) repeat protein
VDRSFDSLATLVEGAVALDTWDIPAAEEMIDRYASGKTSPSVLALLRSRLAFYRQEYDEAARLIGESGSAAAAIPGMSDMATIILDSASLLPKLEKVSSEHFEIAFDPRDKVLSLYALETLEASREKLGALFSLFPERRIRVEVLPDADSFRRVSSLTKRDIEVSGAIGICKFNKIMILSPRVLLRGYPWLDTLAHEYIHYLVVRASKNRAPIWLHEGLAFTWQNRWRTEEPAFPSALDASLLARALSRGKLYTLEEMDPSLIRLPTAEAVALGFAQVGSLIDHFTRVYGPGVIPRLLTAYKEGENLRGAITRATGVPYDKAMEGWMQALRGAGYREIPGLLPPVFLLAEGSEKPPLTEDEVAVASARQRARLGLRLEGIDRPEAAYLEYRRAIVDDPTSPLLLARIAATALATGRVKEAAQAASRGLLTYPDYLPLLSASGRIAVKEGRVGDAKDAFEKAVAVNPFDPEPHQALATLYRAAGNGTLAAREEKALDYLGYQKR